MQGGYKSDANIQGNQISDTQYTLQYWKYVDIFIYFSHHRITIPPVTWTNAAHRNSVLSLGTFIVEWGEGIPEVLKLMYGPNYNPDLPSTQRDFDCHYADRLVDLAVYYNFDGWLINIESPLPSGIHAIVLSRFLKYLTTTIHARKKHSQIIWYDSVISDGSLRWQDQLNTKNALFFDACDSMFVNYTWNEQRIHQSALNAGADKHKLFTGIDVWGRNTFGGGGFNVHRALREVSKNGTGVAIFAPAWTFERFGGESFHQIENRFWEDVDQQLTVELSPDETTKIDNDDLGCISQYLKAKPITNEEFYTDFDTGCGKATFIGGTKVSDLPWTHISHQNILPNDVIVDWISVIGGKFKESNSREIWCDYQLDHSEAYHGGSSVCFSNNTKIEGNIQSSIKYQLFTFNTDVSSKVLKIMYKKRGITFGISLTIQSQFLKEYIIFADQKEGAWDEITIDFEKQQISGVLLKLGLVFSFKNAEGILEYSKQDLGLETHELRDFKVNIGSVYLGKQCIGISSKELKGIVHFGQMEDGKYLIDWSSLGMDFDYACVFEGSTYLGRSFTFAYLLDRLVDPSNIKVHAYKFGKRVTILST
ncbi:hypothetical protein HK103_000692 [Boothiomyces macroporosus]|uniref:Cytosolic endo-beta-N-acetylglucosaminidase TIM barrel domain-containing protein n=1 Tax=Boothiomyces macroporosus TaxID=261099 RepID=A0AAD5Y119_9FUNG|nr:hypothetical protein HK103_000692 [Boothiomyces macroporosus]